SGRVRIEEAVSDVLVDRGNDEVVHKLATNSGTNFSDPGLAALKVRAETDEGLAEKLMRRLDLPLEAFRELLARATEAVRSRLLSGVSRQRQAEVRFVLSRVSKELGQESGRDYLEARN